MNEDDQVLRRCICEKTAVWVCDGLITDECPHCGRKYEAYTEKDDRGITQIKIKEIK